MKPGDLAGRIASEVVLVTIALLIGLASIVIVATYTGAPATGMLKTMLLSWEKLPDMVAEYTRCIGINCHGVQYTVICRPV